MAIRFGRIGNRFAARQLFNLVCKNTKIMFLDADSGEIIVGVSNNFTKEWLEKKYHKIILGIVQNLTDYKVKKLNIRWRLRPFHQGPNH